MLRSHISERESSIHATRINILIAGMCILHMTLHVLFLPDLVEFTDEEGKGKYLPWISMRSMTTTYINLKQIEVQYGLNVVLFMHVGISYAEIKRCSESLKMMGRLFSMVVKEWLIC